MQTHKEEYNHIQHHKNRLLSNGGENHPMIQKCYEYFGIFENAIDQCIQTGNYENYVLSMSEYDEYLWKCNYLEPQKSNPINITQNKKYSSYRENLLLPLFIRVKNRLNFETQVALDKSVVQVLFDDSSFADKDVDISLVLPYEVNGIEKFFPVVTCEDKAGQMCKTTAQNVTGINERFKKMNPNILTIVSTDNHVTIGETEDAYLLNGTDILFPIRKHNLKNKEYQKLNWENFKELEDLLVETLNSRGTESFQKEKYKTKSKSGKIIRESIDLGKMFVNF